MSEQAGAGSQRPNAEQIEDLRTKAKADGETSYKWQELQSNLNLKVTFLADEESFHWQVDLSHKDTRRKLVDCKENSRTRVMQALTTAIEYEKQRRNPATKPEKREKEVRGLQNRTFSDFPAFVPEESLVKPQVLSGNLALVHISNLVQSILLDKLTGRLKIKRSSAWADIFFVDGEPSHATGTRGRGVECFLQLLCWNDGEFEFEPELRVPARSINESLNSLLLKGARLMDDTNFLQTAGLRMSTVPHRTNSFLTEDQFQKSLERRKGFSFKELKPLYLSIDGNRTVEEIVADLDLSRSEWITNMATLLQCNLIALPQDLDEQRLLDVQPIAIQPTLNTLRKVLVNQKTGLLQFEAFLYLLDYELSLGRTPISMAVFSFEPIKTEHQAGQIIRIIKTIPNFKGLVGHNGDNFSIAVLGAKVSRATMMFRQIFRALVEESTEAEFMGGTVQKSSCSIASLPNDVADLPRLLGACELALKEARKGNNRLVVARDLFAGGDEPEPEPEKEAENAS